MRPFDYNKLIEVLRVLKEVEPQGIEQINITDYSDYIYLGFSKIEFAEAFYEEFIFKLPMEYDTSRNSCTIKIEYKLLGEYR